MPSRSHLDGNPDWTFLYRALTERQQMGKSQFEGVDLETIPFNQLRFIKDHVKDSDPRRGEVIEEYRTRVHYADSFRGSMDLLVVMAKETVLILNALLIAKKETMSPDAIERIQKCRDSWLTFIATNLPPQDYEPSVPQESGHE